MCVQGTGCGTDDFTIQMQFALPMVPIALTVYYLVWKYAVRRLNDELGIG